ncbi:MAG: hypothetical protein WDW38_003851 [Sanguina aurantia]
MGESVRSGGGRSVGLGGMGGNGSSGMDLWAATAAEEPVELRVKLLMTVVSLSCMGSLETAAAYSGQRLSL